MVTWLVTSTGATTAPTREQAGGASVYLEFGTINMPPFPFLQPAYDAVYPSIEEGLARLMEHLL